MKRVNVGAALPAVKLRRRHGPHGYANYRSYRPWLRDFVRANSMGMLQ
jgi:hypothetical protein